MYTVSEELEEPDKMELLSPSVIIARKKRWRLLKNLSDKKYL